MRRWTGALVQRVLAPLVLAGLYAGTVLAAAKPSGDRVADYALSLLGVPYRNGGTTPQQGFDCSGLVRHVYRSTARIELARSASEMSRSGTQVARQGLKRGDLVFFNTQGFAYSHVGIYLGQGRFVHAPKRGGVVEVVDMRERYWVARYNGARRVLGTRAAQPGEAARALGGAARQAT